MKIEAKTAGVTQLVYISRRSPELTTDKLRDVVATSSRNNAARAVTGVLLCAGTQVMQVLEGDAAVIEALFEKIKRDPRHTQVVELLRKGVRKRMFPEWGMALAELDRKFTLNRERLSRLLDDVRTSADTANYSVETRVLLSEFHLQLAA